MTLADGTESKVVKSVEATARNSSLGSELAQTSREIVFDTRCGMVWDMLKPAEQIDIHASVDADLVNGLVDWVEQPTTEAVRRVRTGYGGKGQ